MRNNHYNHPTDTIFLSLAPVSIHQMKSIFNHPEDTEHAIRVI